MNQPRLGLPHEYEEDQQQSGSSLVAPSPLVYSTISGQLEPVPSRDQRYADNCRMR